jgi:NAD(P)-dependent dehydrogenase (short-subunit alcohol dehydrogenase family)
VARFYKRQELMNDSLSIVTGANRGIGLSLAKHLKERGANVVAAVRKSSEALDALDVEVVTGVDVGTAEGSAKLSAAVKDRRISLLINNAGILRWPSDLTEPDYDAIREQFEVNALGPLRVVSVLQDNLDKGAKLAFITSRMGSVDDNTSGGLYGYRMSKAALNIAAVSVARDLAEREVSVAVLHPGMVNTEMVGGRGQIEPDDAAAGLLARIDELTLESSGTFWHANGERLPW